MSLLQATMLVAGNMIGTGVFLLPVNLAQVGGIAIFGWVIATLGVAALGLAFAKLGQLDPQPGGPYAYARDFLGSFAGFQTNYVYWFGNWIGNIAIAVAAIGYLSDLVPGIDGPVAGVIATAASHLAADVRQHPRAARGRRARSVDHAAGDHSDTRHRAVRLVLVRPRQIHERLERERRLGHARRVARRVDGAVGLHGHRERHGVGGRHRKPEAQRAAGHAHGSRRAPPSSTC